MESEGLEKVFHAKGDQKKEGVAILISDKIDFEIMAQDVIYPGEGSMYT